MSSTAAMKIAPAILTRVIRLPCSRNLQSRHLAAPAGAKLWPFVCRRCRTDIESKHSMAGPDQRAFEKSIAYEADQRRCRQCGRRQRHSLHRPERRLAPEYPEHHNQDIDMNEIERIGDSRKELR